MNNNNNNNNNVGNGVVWNGMCSWTDPSLVSCGKFYPKKNVKGVELLRFYSSKLGTVEVDASTYTIPTVKRVQKWLEVVPKGFIFHFKAHQIFTHERTEYGKLPILIRETFKHPQGPTAVEITRQEIPDAVLEQLMFLFNLALKEVHEAEKLGVVIFQFPESFGDTAEHRALIARYRQWLDARFVMALELRAKGWYFDSTDLADFKARDVGEPQTTEELTDRLKITQAWVATLPNTMMVAVDEYTKRDVKPTQQVPYPARVIPVLLQTTGDCAYVRIHRRVGNDRLLTDREISDWAARLRTMCNLRNGDLKRVYMMWNTTHEVQAIENGQHLEREVGPMVCSWKDHYLATQKKNPGSILSFFGKPQAKPQQAKEAADTQPQTQPAVAAAAAANKNSGAESAAKKQKK